MLLSAVALYDTVVSPEYKNATLCSGAGGGKVMGRLAKMVLRMAADVADNIEGAGDAKELEVLRLWTVFCGLTRKEGYYRCLPSMLLRLSSLLRASLRGSIDWILYRCCPTKRSSVTYR